VITDIGLRNEKGRLRLADRPGNLALAAVY
jgi:hypothetical protein